MSGYFLRDYAWRNVCAVFILMAAVLVIGVPAIAQSGDEAAVNRAVEALRKAMVDADRAKLTALTADNLSYGHSAGKVESKAEFIDIVADKKTIYKSITLESPSVAVSGNNAVARHIFVTETEAGGKPGSARVGVLQVWTKQGDSWKLFARQAFRL